MLTELFRLVFVKLNHLNSIINKIDYKTNQHSKKTYINERSIEYSFAMRQLSKNKCINVLDVGSGKSAFPAILVKCGYKTTAIDQKRFYWGNNFNNKHYYVVDDDICNSKMRSHSFDAITCISVLEHIPKFKKAIHEMHRILKTNGILILTFPYSHDSYCENVYKLRESDELSSSFNYIGQSYSEENIQQWIVNFGFKELTREYFRGWTGKFWRTGERISFPEVTDSKEKANGICLVLKR